jgi:transposase-like protein
MRETLNQGRLINLEHTKQAIQVIARLYDTVATRLLNWRRQQKLSQIGAPFEAPGAELDRIQAE